MTSSNIVLSPLPERIETLVSEWRAMECDKGDKEAEIIELFVTTGPLIAAVLSAADKLDAALAEFGLDANSPNAIAEAAGVLQDALAEISNDW